MISTALAHALPEPPIRRPSLRWILHLVYHGNPAVKKNSQQLIRRGPYERPLLVPGTAFRRAERAALRELETTGPGPCMLGSKSQPLHLCVHFHLGPRQQPDIDGLIAACADILEKARIIANDYWIASWPGTERFRDPEDPRTEVWIAEEIPT